MRRNIKKANYGPVYAAALYPDLAEIFRSCGYALAVHGSLARDFDLVAIPWAEKVLPPACVLRRVADEFNAKLIGGMEAKPHGRMCQTIGIGFGECSIDLSFVGGVA